MSMSQANRISIFESSASLILMFMSIPKIQIRSSLPCAVLKPRQEERLLRMFAGSNIHTYLFLTQKADSVLRHQTVSKAPKCICKNNQTRTAKLMGWKAAGYFIRFLMYYLTGILKIRE